MALPIGTVLDGKFKIVQVLGEGGMGTVYKVEQVGRPGYFRAVKELLISPNTPEDERKAAIERFNKEIDLLFTLKHPRIPSMILSFQERGNSYFVMEFVPGRSLDKMLEDNKGPLDEEHVIKWMMQVCEALSYIHSRTPPIILRDLKPGNVMVTPEGDVQMIDFGIARRFNPNKRTNTENLGTISYASPEHLGSISAPGQKRTAQNPGKLVQTDARSDIYSLGATMYHLLTNHEPDPIQTPPAGSIRAKNPRLRTVQVNGRMVCPIEQVIIKAMQQDPAHRFQNADAMRTALQQCLPNQAAPATIQIPAMSPNATILVPAAVSGVVCPRCGFQNRPGAKFCKRDGQPLTHGAQVAPPQLRVQSNSHSAIQARPIARQPIQARPVGTAAAAAANSNDPLAAYRRGLQELNNKNYAEAVRQFNLALSLGRPSYDVLYNLGRAYRQYGQAAREQDQRLFKENMTHAAEQFEQAVKNRPSALDAYFQLGMCYHDLGLYSQAIAAFKQALQIAPRDSAIYYQLGTVAMKQGYNREAEAYFLEGLKINPDHALILITLGRLYIETKQYSSAISVLRQATQRDPDQPDGWYELGRAHMRASEWNQALSALEQARQRNPDSPMLYSAMASCYLKMRKRVEARQMVREALQRDPNNAEAIRLQKQL
ncbi:MAG: tetratricopeptide repeat protein [Chloroflexota bacterium]|nr:tetratricopeptide repeat protein [Chloroflexota bacterium]